ncbi:hypothetical protein MTBPR1_30146 [Candidatus Terasakiella magnetica]|uniref:Uncharacterized protein n=1 Tax=Candidatus Terasakiella magnetica TaxID=1867952 RepID=A0A1C3RHM4_9PROT|nr:hypothetical protein MTBPR1_30146 [Candidatus Terasakiella magnetica]
MVTLQLKLKAMDQNDPSPLNKSLKS